MKYFVILFICITCHFDYSCRSNMKWNVCCKLTNLFNKNIFLGIFTWNILITNIIYSYIDFMNDKNVYLFINIYFSLKFFSIQQERLQTIFFHLLLTPPPSFLKHFPSIKLYSQRLCSCQTSIDVAQLVVTCAASHAKLGSLHFITT